MPTRSGNATADEMRDISRAPGSGLGGLFGCPVCVTVWFRTAELLRAHRLSEHPRRKPGPRCPTCGRGR